MVDRERLVRCEDCELIPLEIVGLMTDCASELKYCGGKQRRAGPTGKVSTSSATPANLGVIDPPLSFP